MLPDFPIQKARLLNLWTEYLRRREREYLGYLASAPSYTHHEGNRWRIEGEGGYSNESSYQLIEAEFSLQVKEIPYLTPDEIQKKLDEVAQEMAKQRHRGIIESIQAVATKVGNVGQRQLGKDAYLEALDKILLSFDDEGNPSSPVLLISPELHEAIKDDMETWNQDPEFLERYAKIIQRKREEWRDRESRRKLVD